MSNLSKRVEKLEAEQGASSLHVFALYENGTCVHLKTGKRFASREEAAASSGPEDLLVFTLRFAAIENHMEA